MSTCTPCKPSPGTGGAFEGFEVNITGANSSGDLSGLGSTSSLINALTLGDMGQVSLSAPASATSVSFRAEFTSSSGVLNVYDNGILAASIAPNNLNSFESYTVPLIDPPSSSLIELEAEGSGAGVDISDYSAAAAPEPAAAGRRVERRRLFVKLSGIALATCR